MVLHIVLFRPRMDLTAEERQALIGEFGRARREIPSIRRVWVGRRLTLGTGYDRTMQQDYPYAAILEFEDAGGLESYLGHPAHQALGRAFAASIEAGLMYDFSALSPDALPESAPKN